MKKSKQFWHNCNDGFNYGNVCGVFGIFVNNKELLLLNEKTKCVCMYKKTFSFVKKKLNYFIIKYLYMAYHMKINNIIVADRNIIQ